MHGPPGVFYVGYTEDPRSGFPNHLVNWRTIMVFDVRWCKTEVMPGFRLALDYLVGLTFGVTKKMFLSKN